MHAASPRVRETTVALGAVSTAHGSALVRLGDTFWNVEFEGALFDQWKASWLAYLDIYCLNADGSLFDAALISAVAAFTHLETPLVSVGDDGRVFTVGGNEGKTKFEFVNREKRKLTLGDIPFSLTCALHKDIILADPTSEEESIIETYVTVVVDSSDRIVSIQKLGGSVASMEAIKGCIACQRKEAPVKRCSDKLC
ncbi:hypothetical protein HU200_003531 [Digitaria exilis]|uniref:Exoribonuclease phosphorolytic domain-containing protein n=1 Tax=Digitaria exilis TaxID=1010633 RepID=A0A835FXJ2_9POAL|nr:hypothetical protein HU200_003531 [Digitaria exilis]